MRKAGSIDTSVTRVEFSTPEVSDAKKGEREVERFPQNASVINSHKTKEVHHVNTRMAIVCPIVEAEST